MPCPPRGVRRAASGQAGARSDARDRRRGRARRADDFEVAWREGRKPRIEDYVRDLPEPQREVVVLKHLRGWTLQRIAEHLGRTVPAVASLLRRGLEELRRRLAPDSGEW